MRRPDARVDPDLPRWLLTGKGGLVLPLLTVACALLLLSAIGASLALADGRVTPVTVVVVLAALGAAVWAVADLVWWSRDGRRATVRLPRDPRA